MMVRGAGPAAYERLRASGELDERELAIRGASTGPGFVVVVEITARPGR